MKVKALKELIAKLPDDANFRIYWHENWGRMELYVTSADEEETTTLVEALEPEEDYNAD